MDTTTDTRGRDATLPTLQLRHRAPPTMPRLDIAAATSVGGRERNEDQFLVAHLGRWVRVDSTSVGAPQELTTLQGTLLLVADGMGGEGAGDVASAVATDAFVQHSLLGMPWLAGGTPEGDALLAADLTRFVAACQDRLHDVAARKQLPRRLGTTLTVAYLREGHMVVAHLGDTRAYYLRGEDLVRLTRDHTLRAAIAETTKVDPATIGHANVLTNSIGGSEDAPRIELTSAELAAGDRLLLCSDGLHGVIDDARIAAMLRAATTARGAVDALVAEALARGTSDNVTAVVAFG